MKRKNMSKEYKKWTNYIKFILLISWMILIFSFSAKEADESTRTSQSAGSFLASVVIPEFNRWNLSKQQDFVENIDFFVRKSAHFTEYMVLGILWTICWNGRKRRSFLCGSLYAVTDEVHQLFVDGRSCQITDMLLDSIGVGAGIFFLWIVQFLIHVWKRRNSHIGIAQPGIDKE